MVALAAGESKGVGGNGYECHGCQADESESTEAFVHEVMHAITPSSRREGDDWQKKDFAEIMESLEFGDVMLKVEDVNQHYYCNHSHTDEERNWGSTAQSQSDPNYRQLQ